MHKFLILVVLLIAMPAFAEETTCKADNRACVIEALTAEAGKIENVNWRDQTYREIAKTLAFESRIDDALKVWDKIENPDTRAITIRGIGMAAADLGLDKAVYTTLREKAEGIDHPPSYAIALTYIAMAQAFAGDNDGAWATAADMENEALRHKAYGETAEIQAEAGDFQAAMKSISLIESAAYRNKSYALVSKILADRDDFENSLKAARKVENAYKKATALQYILDKQNPRESRKP